MRRMIVELSSGWMTVYLWQNNIYNNIEILFDVSLKLVCSICMNWRQQTRKNHSISKQVIFTLHSR